MRCVGDVGRPVGPVGVDRGTRPHFIPVTFCSRVSVRGGLIRGSRGSLSYRNALLHGCCSFRPAAEPVQFNLLQSRFCLFLEITREVQKNEIFVVTS